MADGNWIAGAITHPGSFSAAAKRAGKSTSAFAREHAGDSGTLGRRARLAQTLMGMHKGHAAGGSVSAGLPGLEKRPRPMTDNPNDTPAMERAERRRGIRT